MEAMFLYYFTNEEDFPFFIHFGSHETDLIMHTHADFSEIVVVLSGTAMHYVNDEAYFIKKGDVFVINTGTAHGYKNTNDFRLCNIMYRSEKLIPFGLDIRKSAGFHALFVIEPYLVKSQSFQSRLTLGLNDFELVNKMIADMVAEFDKKADGYKTLLQASFMTLTVMLSRIYSLPGSDIKTSAINIAKSVSYIENHYTETIYIENLAEWSNLSMRHFTRIFKDTYQITPGNYILALRMQNACRLLKNTSLNISEIAYQCGFNDSNYFSRQFRKQFTLTPKKYRSDKK